MEPSEAQWAAIFREDLPLLTQWCTLRQKWFQYPQTQDQTLPSLLNTFLTTLDSKTNSPLSQTIHDTSTWILETLSSNSEITLHSSTPMEKTNKPKEMIYD